MKKYNVYYKRISTGLTGHKLISAKDEKDAICKFNIQMQGVNITRIEFSKGFYI